MPRSLLISVRFHEGRYHGQDDQFGGSRGWPPSPARLFQALVAGTARGAVLRGDDQRALRWLECLPPPRIAAPPIHRGQPVKRFVPNNDLDAVGGNPGRIGEVRVGKEWRPCFFDADQPVIYVWDFESESGNAKRVCTIAARLCQLGKGVDMAWAEGQVLKQEEAQVLLESHPGSLRVPAGAGKVPVPCSGTLHSLTERYQSNRRRLRFEGSGRKTRQLFFQPPKAVFGQVGYDTPARSLHFELRWNANEKNGFAARPLASAASLLPGLRDGAANRLKEALPEKTELVNKLIVGRGAGPADLARRVRLVPIPSIGTAYTDPSIRRIMVEVPPDCPWRLDDLAWAFSGLEIVNRETGEPFDSVLVPTHDDHMANRFKGTAQDFQSITPLVLPAARRRRIGPTGQKTAEERGQEEEHAIGAVVQALRHAGVRSRPCRIEVQREPFQRRGVRAELFAQGSRFSKHALWHVALGFREPIPGPLIIGDGRFYGLGLMAPDHRHRNVFAFNIGRRVASRHWPLLVHSLRRALMSLASDERGRLDRLFSGHEQDGSSDRAGHHAHVFLAVADGRGSGESTTRLIVAAPWAADRRAFADGGDMRRFNEVTQTLKELRTRSLGRFKGLNAEPVGEGDGLMGPAHQWECETPYLATRNLKKGGDLAAFLVSNVTKECMDRGWPKPVEVQVSDASVGPRGGRPTAMLSLCFASAVHGPLMLGRDSHAGGGLFRAVL